MTNSNTIFFFETLFKSYVTDYWHSAQGDNSAGRIGVAGQRLDAHHKMPMGQCSDRGASMTIGWG